MLKRRLQILDLASEQRKASVVRRAKKIKHDDLKDGIKKRQGSERALRIHVCRALLAPHEAC